MIRIIRKVIKINSSDSSEDQEVIATAKGVLETYKQDFEDLAQR